MEVRTIAIEVRLILYANGIAGREVSWIRRLKCAYHLTLDPQNTSRSVNCDE
jgi:hypothetical protein